MVYSILIAALVFAVLVVVHEAGHFAMAKKVGVRVLRFSIGYPPKILGFRRGETEYSIGATPFGGYVRMLGDEVGEDPKSEELTIYLREIGLDIITAARSHRTLLRTSKFEDDLRVLADRMGATTPVSIIGRELKPDEALLINEIRRQPKVDDAIKALAENPPSILLESFKRRAFPTQPLGKRVLIVLAGPLANILFAPLLLTLVFMTGVPELLPVVGAPTKGLPAAEAGLQPGDRILSVNGHPTETWADFSQTIKAGDGSQIKLEVARQVDGTTVRKTLVIKPTRLEQKTIYGTPATTWVIGVPPAGKEIVKRYGPIGAVKEACTTSVEMTGQMIVGIASIFAGSVPVRDALGGPIIIAQMVGKEAHQGFSSLAMFTVMLSLQLGIINLLPVPLLDGGHLLFFVFEGVRGEPLELRYREMMLQVGLFLLVALMAFVIFNDISRIVQG
jgi:regulator of sigma E protease